MPKLKNFPTARQETANSCWACAAREINNWYHSLGKSASNPLYKTDQEFATAWADATPKPNDHADIDIQQSAAAALEDLRYTNNTDDHAIPNQQEIADTISGNQPLLAIVGGTPPNPDPNPNFQNGHWVVIVGISDDKANIDVFDPDDGQVHTVAYNASTYVSGVYWQNTSYVDPQ